MRNANLSSLAVLLLALPCLAVAGGADGAGVRGGGQVIDVNATPELTDLVSHARCDWHTGDDMIAANPNFISEVIQPLSKLDWYFANEILTEAHFLRYCLTGSLMTVRPDDPGSVVLPPDQTKVTQVGYRLNGTIYLDSDLFYSSEMTDHDRAYILLHEVMHSYLPMTVPERNLKLRSIVHAISAVESGQITTRDELHFQMTSNDIDFPTTVSQLDPYRAEIEYLLEPAAQQAQDLLGLKEIDTILDLPADVIASLSRWDQALLQSDPPKQMLSDAFSTDAIHASDEAFASLLKDPRFQRLTPAVLLLSSLDQLSAAKQNTLVSGDLRTELYGVWFAPILNATLTSLSDGRTALSPDTAEALAGAGATSLSILDLPLPSKLPQTFSSLDGLLVKLAQQGRWDLIDQLAGAGSPLGSVLGLTALQQQIQQFKFQYPLEQEFSGRRVALFSEVLKRLLVTDLSNELEAPLVQQLLTHVPSLNSSQER